jgi:hypothetical protein
MKSRGDDYCRAASLNKQLRKIMKYTKIDKHGNITDNKCPICDGEGVDFLDFTNARGGNVHFQLCYLCDGSGIAEEGKDFDIVSFTDEKGKEHIGFEKINNIGE